MVVPEVRTQPPGLRRSRLLQAAVALVAAATLLAPVASEATILNKRWERRTGEWASHNWTTTRRATQTLKFTSCSHNWAYGWGQTRRITIELVEVRNWMPDVVRGSSRYACSGADHRWVSGRTNSTRFHFDFNPDGSYPVRTSGTMSIRHSE